MWTRFCDAFLCVVVCAFQRQVYGECLGAVWNNRLGWLVGLLDLLSTELSLETQVLVKQPWRFTYVDHINSFQDWF